MIKSSALLVFTLATPAGLTVANGQRNPAMARWKLMTPHYLNVEGETWEYTENDRQTGRPKRVQFPVLAS